MLARWTIKPRLMGVPGVANVAIWGHRERQLQVQFDPEQLQKLKVTQEQIIKTAGDALYVSPLTFLNASFPGTGGWIDTPNQRLGVQHVLPISSPEDLARVPVDGAWDFVTKPGNVNASRPETAGPDASDPAQSSTSPHAIRTLRLMRRHLRRPIELSARSAGIHQPLLAAGSLIPPPSTICLPFPTPTGSNLQQGYSRKNR